MGVHGLWKLLEPSGQMVPLESLAGKVLAVDVSIWLHQAMKGVHDANGAPLAVAHLLILFHRLCKLLFYKIKPVFVFDGGVPALKHQTMVARRQRSTAARNEAMKVREKLIKNLLKHEAVRQMLSDETASAVLGLNSFTLPGPSVEEDLYKLPPIAADYVDSESSEASNTGDEDEERHAEDIHSIDVTSQEFLSLPAEVRHDILTELIETRKQSSWKYLEAMPKKSDSFSDFQMSRLLKRHAVQTSLEKAGKEMGGRALSLKELESLLGDRGVLDPKADLPSRRIAQDNVTRFMLIQKDGGSEKTEEEQFDIMNHLEDVEWSSESDTDVILEQKSQKGNADSIPKQSTEKKVPAVDEVKREPCLLSKQAKVRVTDEVADILSVLEDEDVSSDVKVKLESLQSQISSNENSNHSNPEDSKGVESKQLEEKPVSPETNENDKEMEWSHAHHIPEGELCRNGNEDRSREEEDTEAKETTGVEEKMEEEPKSSISNVNDEKAKGKGDSSSDSESDFIPITESRSSSPRNDGKNVHLSQPAEEVANREFAGDSLTVVINPLEVEEADDLFADVFKEDDEVSDGKKDSKEGVDEAENGFKAEFEQRMSTGDLNHLKKTLEEERDLLMREKGKQERHAANLADHVYSDAQELLRLFGVPFVIAPMEAEAQCAALNAIGLTEGTITDDSDIWLFGGRVVYKNFFNQNKHVLEYRSESIQKYFKLSREDMIRMALLVGSDYTLGLNGVGPVTALEILAAFRGPNQGFIDSLQRFRDWFIGTSKTGPPRTTLRRKIKNAVISPGFPNVAVVEAYLHPQVDDSKEPFSWAKPNLELIRKYAKAKMGWSTEKCNEVLLPVLKKLEEKTGQTTIEKHFKIVQKSSFVEGLLSKRVENAIKRLGSESFEETDPKPKRKRRAKKADEMESASREGEDGGESSRTGKEAKPGGHEPSEGCSKNVPLGSESKMKLIKEKLHKNLRVPQREMAQKLKEERKKEAIQIFRTYKGGGRKKMKVFAKEEANLSESSSEND